MNEVEELKREIAHYKKVLGLSESNMAYKGYMAYQKVLEQYIQHIDQFKLTKEILEGKKTENAYYERTDAMFKTLPEMISSLNRLKSELKIEFDPQEGKPKIRATSPQSIGM